MLLELYGKLVEGAKYVLTLRVILTYCNIIDEFIGVKIIDLFIFNTLTF